MENGENNAKPSPNITPDSGRNSKKNLIKLEVGKLYDAMGQRGDLARINLYAEALSDLTVGQLQHGFPIVLREVGEFLPSISQIRDACLTFRNQPEVVMPPLEIPSTAEDYLVSRAKQHATHEEVMKCLEEGKRAQQEHIAKLKADPQWQQMVKNLNGKR